ncbi:MAG TPA: acetoin utilization protein AcuC [Burkholderiales bacterium]|nr:acetoin utilization protein AcuC [Burkholderiales bacterium]
MLAPVFVSHDLYRQAGYGAHHPLAIARVGPVMDLCRALGWLDEDNYRVSPRASDDQLAAFHTREYIRALRRASESGQVDAEARRRHALGTMENPLFAGLFERAATSVGGSILAAELALQGRVAFHPAGGTHHGRPDRASGFCYFNDPVFAILTLLGAGLDRVLYVDLDAHHCDGVQDAFARDARVHTVSIHEQGRWPHSGGASGERACNLPVPREFNDSELEALMEGVVMPLARRMRPQAMVITCGADALAGDPLSHMALSNVALWSAVERLAASARAAVVLGGGGYNPWTVARYWTGLWGTLSGRRIPALLPPAARAILAALDCDLVEDEERQACWLTTLADAPNPGPLRPPVAALLEESRELA